MNRMRSILLLLLLGWTTTVAAQQNYAFVSPNTRENLKIEDAITGMNSAEETALRMKAVNLSCVVRSRIRAYRALGAWSDGAEHSVLVRVQSNEATLRYLMSRMGRDAQQKYVVYFSPRRGGEDEGQYEERDRDEDPARVASRAGHGCLRERAATSTAAGDARGEDG